MTVTHKLEIYDISHCKPDRTDRDYDTSLYAKQKKEASLNVCGQLQARYEECPAQTLEILKVPSCLHFFAPFFFTWPLFPSAFESLSDQGAVEPDPGVGGWRYRVKSSPAARTERLLLFWAGVAVLFDDMMFVWSGLVVCGTDVFVEREGRDESV